MMLNRIISGRNDEEMSGDALFRETTRASQEIRTYQSLSSLWLIAVVGIAYSISLWDNTNPVALVTWILVIVICTTSRAYSCIRIRRNLESADGTELLQNDVVLFYTAMLQPFLVGLGYWIVCLPGDQEAILAVTVLSCVYSVGSTINSVAQQRILWVMLLVNLGQGILFFAWLGNNKDAAVAIMLFGLLALLQGFGRRNGVFFIESVGMRLENQAQNEQLRQNRALIESTLNSALEANRSKNHFLAAASHDLSQPLTAMSFFIGSLKHNVEKPVQIEIVSKLEGAATMLKNQFASLLDLAHFDAGGLVVENKSFDVLKLCEDLVGNVQPDADFNKIDLELSGDNAIIFTDPVLMGRLLGNLIHNAIKFTSVGSVRVEVVRIDDHVMIYVKDTGCGIAAADTEIIFGDFTQLKNPARVGSEGSGVGLSIVRRIAELLGVEITLQSQLGEGSCFSARIPISGLAAMRSIASQNDRSVGEPITRADLTAIVENKVILIVDDNQEIREALGSYLADLGGECLLAANYEEAVAHCNRANVHLAILDDMLHSSLSGLELAIQISPDVGVQNIVMVTGNDAAERLNEIESRGFTVFKKPLASPQIDKIVAERLQK